MRKPLSVKQITKPLKTRVFATEGSVGRKNESIFELRCIFMQYAITENVYLCKSDNALSLRTYGVSPTHRCHAVQRHDTRSQRQILPRTMTVRAGHIHRPTSSQSTIRHKNKAQKKSVLSALLHRTKPGTETNKTDQSSI